MAAGDERAARQAYSQAAKAIQASANRLTKESKTLHRKLDSLAKDPWVLQLDFTQLGRELKKWGDGTQGSKPEPGGTDALRKVLEGWAPDRAGSMAGGLWGSTAGAGVSGGVSGALRGFSLGKALGASPGLGMAAGAAVAGFEMAIAVAKKQDEAFSKAVSERHQGILAQQKADLASGSALAAQREKDTRFYAALWGADQAGAYGAWLGRAAVQTPLGYDGLTRLSKPLASWGYTPQQLEQLLPQLGDAGAHLGLDADGLGRVADALGRLHSADSATLSLLEELTSQGLPALDYLAKGLGVSRTYAQQMVQDGLLPGAEAAQKIADAMGEASAGALAAQSGDFASQAALAKQLEQEGQAALGKAYNDHLLPALTQYNTQMQGELGDQLRQGYAIVGAWQAQQKGEQLGSQLKAKRELVDSSAYQQALAQQDGAALYRLLNLSDLEADRGFFQSSTYQSYQQNELKLVEGIRQGMSGIWQNYGYQFQEAYSKGLLRNAVDKIPRDTLSPELRMAVGDPLGDMPAHAAGLSYVPRDNYPARLHQGERVLTAAEARQYGRGGGSVQVMVTGNSFSVRGEEDIAQIAQALWEQIRQAWEVS